MPRKPRTSYKTMSLEGLERDPDLSGEWSWQTPFSKVRWETYKLSESETEKTHTISYLRVDFKREDIADPWREEQRYKYYRRQTKYLAINGPLEGQKIVVGTPDYKLFYTQYGTGDSNLPRKIMIHVDSLARKLGLLW